MGETATKDEAAAAGGLAELLAEAAAGLAGADERLAARLRPDLQALLDERLAREGPMAVADAGQLVVRHWHRLAGTAGSREAGGASLDPSVDTSDARGGGRAAAGAKSKRRAKGRPSRPADEDRVVPPVDDPLFAEYAEEAAGVMQQLVCSALERDGGEGAALRSLQALAVLARVDPPLARVTRLRWFAGLDNAALARRLGTAEPEVQRLWLKARSFLAAASRTAQPA